MWSAPSRNKELFALALTKRLSVSHAHVSVVTFVIGGILGAIFFLALFDWALIVFSSIEGAHLIQSAIPLPPTGTTILLLALVVAGIVFQASMMRRGLLAVRD